MATADDEGGRALAPYADRRGQLMRLTREQAAFVRLLCEQGYSMRALARACYEAWGMAHHPVNRWEPPEDQQTGHELCYVAARHVGEDPTQDPWTGLAHDDPYPPLDQPWPPW